MSGSAQVVYQESLSPNAPPQLMDCANINNIGDATELPLKKTTDRYTLFIRYDYEEDKNVITFPQLQAMQSREDALRLASWPLAALDSHISSTMLFHDHGSWFPFFEPFTSVLGLSIGAQLGGIDRMVLSVRNNWFAENLFRHQFIANGTIGYSLGWFAPHAVLAEDGYFGVAVHELGTHVRPEPARLQHGRVRRVRDDRASAARRSPGRGSTRRARCSRRATSHRARDCVARSASRSRGRSAQPNIMDANSPVRYDNWIDPFTYHYLMDKALPHVDPPLLALAAVVHLPNGPGDGSAPPVIEGSLPLSAYQFMGNQDLEMAPLSFDGETFLGVGPYRVRFVTPTGVREYRVEPHMIDSASSPEQIGAIALNFPWDPATVRIELLGPVDLRNDGCWNRYCPGDSVLLASRLVSPAAPSASDLRAGRDAAAPPTPPGSTPATPTVGPNHEAVVSWTASDADSPELRATLLLAPQDAAGGTGGPSTPVGIELTGSSFRIPHTLLADAPGLYTGRVLVSDGVNTAEVSRGQLFSICNLQNGGLELCNGVDDDCDGLTDNTPPGPVESVMLNPQPYPPTPAGTRAAHVGAAVSPRRRSTSSSVTPSPCATRSATSPARRSAASRTTSPPIRSGRCPRRRRAVRSGSTCAPATAPAPEATTPAIRASAGRGTRGSPRRTAGARETRHSPRRRLLPRRLADRTRRGGLPASALSSLRSPAREREQVQAGRAGVVQQHARQDAPGPQREQPQPEPEAVGEERLGRRLPRVHHRERDRLDRERCVAERGPEPEEQVAAAQELDREQGEPARRPVRPGSAARSCGRSPSLAYTRRNPGWRDQASSRGSSSR